MSVKQMKVGVITTTYNRKSLLYKLYETLIKQSDSEFIWIVVNDGSTDGTDELIKNIIIPEGKVDVRYYYKENGGKGSALNLAFDNAMYLDFVVVIDDDEILYSDAIEKVKRYCTKYYKTCCGAMEFLRDDLNGNPIANYSKNDFFMSVPERKRRNYYIDGYAGYYVYALDGVRYPIFDNEKYIGSGFIQGLISENYDLLWPNVSLGTTEYLEGGLTRSGRKLRLNSPLGMILYCVMKQDKGYDLKTRLGYSAMGFAYKYYAGLNNRDLTNNKINISSLSLIMKPFGLILSIYWRIRY